MLDIGAEGISLGYQNLWLHFTALHFRYQATKTFCHKSLKVRVLKLAVILEKNCYFSIKKKTETKAGKITITITIYLTKYVIF